MVRRRLSISISGHGLQVCRFRSSLSISVSPAPSPSPPRLFQAACRSPAPVTEPSLLLPLLLDRSNAHHRRSGVLLQEPRFSELLPETEEPNQERNSADTYGSMLQRYVGSAGPSAAQSLHLELIKTGFLGDLFLSNTLVKLYAKWGKLNMARQIFAEMPEKNAVSWTCLISGYAQSGQPDEACSLFRSMLSSGFVPTEYTFGSVLRACQDYGPQCLDLGAQVHALIFKIGYPLDPVACNALISIVTYACPSSAASFYLCLLDQVLAQIIKSGFMDDLYVGSALISAFASACAEFSRPEEGNSRGREIHGFVIRNGLSDYKVAIGNGLVNMYAKCGAIDEASTTVENAILSCYAKCGDMDACEQLFVNMSDRRDNLSWNCMVAGYVDNGLLPKAMDFVWLMMHDGQKLDHFTFATVLNACASVAALERGMEMHAFCIRSHMKSDIVVESALIDMYSKCGRINYATNVFRSMALKNEFSWNSMISGYARHGHAEKAIVLFNEMQKGQQQPDHVTFVGVLSACSHVGKVEQGLQYFDSMSEKYGISPRLEHYSCMVDLLGRAGKLDEMECFLKRMPMKPNALIWRTVLAACCRTKDGAMVNLGKQAGEMLLELEPENPVNFILISKLFASRGCWDNVAKTRNAMRSALVKKEAGCSWVTMKDGIHVFTAGDRSHPNMEVIYAKLSILIQKTKDAGYIPQTKFALYDLDMEDKEELLSCHSEKLAVAFVLTRSSGLPIRIMKNIRVLTIVGGLELHD
ncbi:hypothetical protein Taro_006080 [Colocasia esculenta]|uniref:DYW domain-containing protein n=1 Tax=Colocasia esculenta TaxID=4460 RepID=A0A843TMQ8_COLES|nr:hypothetical protein [Colocasia esculenta]